MMLNKTVYHIPARKELLLRANVKLVFIDRAQEPFCTMFADLVNDLLAVLARRVVTFNPFVPC